MRKPGSIFGQKTNSLSEVWMKRKPHGSLVRGTRHIETAVNFINELFIILLTTAVLLLLLESIWVESVSTYLNLNYFFIAAIASGVIVIISRPQMREETKERLLDNRSIIILCLSGLAVSVMIYCKIREIGWPSYFISITSGVLTMLMLLIVWREDDEREDS